MKAELVIDAPIIGEKKIWVKKICKPYFDHPFHYHQLLELVWLEKSFGKLIIGDYIGNFSEGELILKNAGLPHLWRCDPVFYENRKDLYTKAITTYFPPSLIPNMTDNPYCLKLYNDLLTKSERGLRFYGQAKKDIIELVKKVAVAADFAQLAYFLQIISILSKTNEFEYLASVSYKNNNNEQEMDRFNRIYQFLLKNFHRDITLQEVASVGNMTPNSFCRFFKTKTQKTFVRFLNELRIGHACKLLQNENESVVNIGYECGYNNPVNFFKLFKLITNKSPKEYRKQIKKMEENFSNKAPHD